MEDNIDEIFNDIDNDINTLDDRLGKHITEHVLTQIKGSPNLKGNLQSLTVQWDTVNQKVQLGMEIYGLFINFGVIGFDGTNLGANDVDKELWGLGAVNGLKFQFQHQMIGGDLPFAVRKEIGMYGLKAEPFLPTREQVDIIINEFIKEYENI